MEVGFFKIFFSRIKETEWLNKLGKSGYLLKRISDSKYYFEINEDAVYYYSIEHLDHSPKSENSKDLMKSRADKGENAIFYDKNWVYFVSDNEIISDTPVLKRSANYHFWKSIYYFFFGFAASVLTGYQFYAIEMLERAGQSGDGRLGDIFRLTRSESTLQAILNAIKKAINYISNLLNVYISLWTNIFGESEAVIVISFAAPIAIFFLVIGAMHLNEYLLYLKNINTEIVETEETVDNAEQTI